MNIVLVSKIMKYYQRKKKTVGYKRDVPFRYPYIAKIVRCMEKVLVESYTTAMLWQQYKFVFDYGLDLISWLN